MTATVIPPVATARTNRRLGGMTRLFTRWVLGPVITLLVASFLIFAALTRASGDPVASLLGNHATAAQVTSLRHKLGLDQSLPVRYWHWLLNALHGHFGDSITYRVPVSSLLAPRVETTLFLVLYAGALCIVVGITLGVIGATVRPASPVIAALTAIGVAIPSFVAAIMLISFFSLDLGWFPTGGAGNGFSDRLWHMTLPAIALACAWTAYLTQVTRSAIVEQRGKEHVETAHMRGLPTGRIFRHHIARNAAPPVLTVSALTIAGLIVGAVVVESAFGIDGVGSFLVSAVQAKDYNVVEALSLIIVAAFILATTLIDIAEVLLDPRLRRRAVR